MDWSQIAVIVLAAERAVGKTLDFLRWREARKLAKAKPATVHEGGPVKLSPVKRRK